MIERLDNRNKTSEMQIWPELRKYISGRMVARSGLACWHTTSSQFFKFCRFYYYSYLLGRLQIRLDVVS